MFNLPLFVVIRFITLPWKLEEALPQVEFYAVRALTCRHPRESPEKIFSLLGGVHHLQVLLTRTIKFATERFDWYSWHIHYSEVLRYSSLNLLHMHYSPALAMPTKLYTKFLELLFQSDDIKENIKKYDFPLLLETRFSSFSWYCNDWTKQNWNKKKQKTNQRTLGNFC